MTLYRIETECIDVEERTHSTWVRYAHRYPTEVHSTQGLNPDVSCAYKISEHKVYPCGRCGRLTDWDMLALVEDGSAVACRRHQLWYRLRNRAYPRLAAEEKKERNKK